MGRNIADSIVITCPQCRSEIPLTETLAAPFIAATREKIVADERERTQAILEEERQKLKLAAESEQAKDKELLEQEIAKSKKMAEESAEKARKLVFEELEAKSQQLEELLQRDKDREQKLAEAQKAQAEIMKKSRELDDAKREFELTIQKRVFEEKEELRAKARQESDEQNKLKLLERDQTILSMQKKIEELMRKAEQGSQQLQGEVMELELEELLRSRFPSDSIEPVPKGEFGGDILQRVNDPARLDCGTIIWELKRTRNWSDGWLAKLRDDQRAAKAEIAVLVSQALPKSVEFFDIIEGVWVVSQKVVVPVADILRRTLIEVCTARQVSDGAKTKAEAMYEYLTGTRFKQRVGAMVEAWEEMRSDLNAEKKVITKQWSKREKQIDRVMESTVGMYGDMQGIAGKGLQEIEGLEFKALD